MAISEEKMRMVIKNYFKTECDINTTINEAFEKGFRIGVQKGISAQPEIIRCKDCKRNIDNGGEYPDGRTRCPIQEHYALLQDGFCHLGERK